MNKDKLLELVIPSLEGFKLRPYVANSTVKQKYPTARQLYSELNR